MRSTNTITIQWLWNSAVSIIHEELMAAAARVPDESRMRSGVLTTAASSRQPGNRFPSGDAGQLDWSVALDQYFVQRWTLADPKL